MSIKKPRTRKQIAATKKLVAANKKRALSKKGKKRVVRGKNPVGLTRSQKITAAMKLFRKFHVMDPTFIDEIDVEKLDVGVVIGECDGILYTTVREGKKESYVHEFGKRSKPILASSYDGKQLFVVAGNYEFTERGIVDKG